MIERLKALGFKIEVMVFEDTTNFWARRGTEALSLPLLATLMLYLLAQLEQWTLNHSNRLS